MSSGPCQAIVPTAGGLAAAHRLCDRARTAESLSGEKLDVRGRQSCISAVLLLVLCARLSEASPAAADHKFQADEWITECDDVALGAPDCSITVPFWQTQDDQKGSFALVVMLQTGNIGIVGQPFPIRAMLRVDKNPPIECRQSRYCVFPGAQSLAVLKQLKIGSLILIDVMTAKTTFQFSLTPKGYQAGIAQIRAWGYSLPVP
jgi:invasion protein IalB